MANVIDQSQTTDNNSLTVRHTTVNEEVGQRFIPSVSAELSQAAFKLLKIGSPSGNIWVKLYANGGSDLPGTLLASSDTKTASSISGSATEYTFDFTGANRYTLVSGTKYHIALAGDYTRSDSNAIQIRSNTNGGYADGILVRIGSSSTWEEDVGDLYFKEYYDDTTLPGRTSVSSRTAAGSRTTVSSRSSAASRTTI